MCTSDSLLPRAIDVERISSCGQCLAQYCTDRRPHPHPDRLECVREPNHETKYQPNENFVEILFRVKMGAVRERENASEHIFWTKNRQPNSNTPSTLFFIWKKVTVTARVTHVQVFPSHDVTYRDRPPEKEKLFWFENSAFGKYKIWKLDLYLAPPQIETSLKYNLTQKFPERTLGNPTNHPVGFKKYESPR